jgi:S1-C subfamily serine protease
MEGDDGEEDEDESSIRGQGAPALPSTGSMNANTHGSQSENGERRSFRNLPFQTLVKIFVTKLPQNWKSPWRKPNQKRCTGTGFILPNKMVVTNAHVINGAISIRCRQHGQTQKARAHIVLKSHDSDLALLRIEDDTFWEKADGAQVVLRDDLPELGEAITVIGYPLGDHASVTKGVVSRCVLYSYINIQIDAALNPGNSGGPAFDSEGRCVGVARAHTVNAQLMCYIIPIPVLSLLLMDFTNASEYSGMPSLGIRAQTLESAALRRQLSLNKSELNGIGVRITKVLPFRNDDDSILQVNDVLVSINEKEVGQDGTVALRGKERIGFMHEVRCLRVGQPIKLKIIRQGQNVDLSLKLRRLIKKIPSEHDPNGCPPSGPQYCVFAGVVFVPLTTNWMKAVKMSLKSHPLLDAALDFQEGLDEQHIMLSHILSHDCNFGYHSVSKKIVSEINGIKPKNMRHFAEILGKLRRDALAKDRQDGSSQGADCMLNIVLACGYKIVLDCKEGIRAEDEVCSQHSIAKIFSQDLQEFV